MESLLLRTLLGVPALTGAPPPSVFGWRDRLQRLDAEAQVAAAENDLGAIQAEQAAAAAALRQAELTALAASVVGPATVAPTATATVVAAQARLHMLRRQAEDSVDLVAQARLDLGLDDDTPYLR